MDFKTKIGYINFMMWFQSDTSHLNYDPVTAAEKYIEYLGEPGKDLNCDCDPEHVCGICYLDKGYIIDNGKLIKEEPDKEVCNNCGAKVEMVSMGKMCPNCACDN